MVVIFVVVIFFGVVREVVLIFVVVKVWELREVSRCDSRCHLLPLPIEGSVYQPLLLLLLLLSLFSLFSLLSLLSLLLLLFVLSYCSQSVGGVTV